MLFYRCDKLHPDAFDAIFSVGDYVRIRYGPYSGCVGIIHEIMHRGDYSVQITKQGRYIVAQYTNWHLKMM